MTIKHQISILDHAIIWLRSERNQFAATDPPQWQKVTTRVKQHAKKVLQQIGVEDELIKQIDKVAFQRSAHTLHDNYKYNIDALIESHQAGVDAIISILDDYRQTLKEKQNYIMLLWTLIFSAIAAVGTILSFLIHL